MRPVSARYSALAKAGIMTLSITQFGCSALGIRTAETAKYQVVLSDGDKEKRRFAKKRTSCSSGFRRSSSTESSRDRITPATTRRGRSRSYAVTRSCSSSSPAKNAERRWRRRGPFMRSTDGVRCDDTRSTAKRLPRDRIRAVWVGFLRTRGRRAPHRRRLAVCLPRAR
jgi:hypothetical protein